MIIKDGKKYYTLEESSKILDEMILEDAKEFAKKSYRNAKRIKNNLKKYDD